jgi:hypothetical protein
MTVSEWTMGILTLAGIVIASLTGLIFYEQLHEMRTDQRAWINLTVGAAKVTKDSAGNASITVPITISNTGKSPAKKVLAEVVVEKVRNGDSPEFIYENRSRTYSVSGTLVPNATEEMDASLLKGKLHGTGEADSEPVFLTPFQYQDLTDGTSFLAVYARTSYVDVFDIPHSLRSCFFSKVSAPQPALTSAKACTLYNDVDNN